jgi:hypothetical protein
VTGGSQSYFQSAIAAFLTDAALPRPPWLDLEGGLAALVDRLKTLREEGAPLRPDVYFFADEEKARLEEVLGFHHLFRVGAKSRDEAVQLGPQLFEQAVKRCAPLAKGEWSIFVKWTASQVHFGVMRRRDDLVRPAARHVLGEPVPVRVVLAYQIAENIVALRGGGGLARDLDFFASPRLVPSAEQDRRWLARAIAAHVEDPATRAHAEAVVVSILHAAVGSGHGFLTAVKAHGDGTQAPNGEWLKAPKPHYAMVDGTYFPKWPIPLEAKLASYALARRGRAEKPPGQMIDDALSLSEEILAWRGLVPSMLCADGLTLFDTRAQVLGFNIFVGKLRKEDVAKTPRFAPPEGRFGGARWRAFGAIRQLVDAGALVGAYYQSQDGASAWYGPR